MLFASLLNKNHGLLYTTSNIDTSEIHFTIGYKESVFVKLKFKNGKHVTIGNIYRSPNSSKEEDENLCDLIDEVAKATNQIITSRGFQFSDINWDIFHTDSTGSSHMFLDTLQDNLLIVDNGPNGRLIVGFLMSCCYFHTLKTRLEKLWRRMC